MLGRIAIEVRQDMPQIWRGFVAMLRSFVGWVWSVRADFAVAAMVAIAMGFLTLTLSQRVPVELTQPNTALWFESDIPRINKTMTVRGPHNYRTYVHPLQTLLMYVPVKAMTVAGLSERAAILAYLTIVSGLWAGFFYGALRGLTLRRPDALVFTALGASTSASIFWFPVQESYGVGALSLMICFALGTAILRRRLPEFVHALASAASFAITTTNWMAGILLAFAANSYKRAFRVTFDALLIVTVLFAIQKALDPNSQFFVPGGHEATYMFDDASGSALDKLSVFLVFAVSIPPVPFLDNLTAPDWFRLSIQGLNPWSVAPVGLAGFAVWAVLLAGGAIAGLRNAASRRMAEVLLLFVLFQAALHQVYGDETFLFSLNYVPPMVLLAACGALSGPRRLVLAAAVAATVLLAFNNLGEFFRVTSEMADRIAAIQTR